MTVALTFLLLGLANGAVFASLALGLVVTFRSSGVINFATAEIALVTAYMYAYFRQGRLLLLVPGTPTTVRLNSGMSFVPAAILALLFAAILGLVLYLIVFRPLRRAPAVARAVASLGVMVVLTGLLIERLGNTTVYATGIFPTDPFTIGSVTVSQDRVWFAVTVVVIAVLVGAAFRFTPFGLRTRAAADSEKGAYVSGISLARVASYNWVISAVVSGLAGILIAPIVPLEPASYTLFIVPALAAATVGRFQYLGPAAVGGLLIGMLQSEATYLSNKYTWLPASGLDTVVPLLVVFVVLIVRSRPLPERGAIIIQTLGKAPRPRRIVPTAVVGFGLGLAVIFLLHTGNWRASFDSSLGFGVICLSTVVVTGYAGQVSLAQLSLAGAAGFILGPMTASWGIPFPLAPLLAALVSSLIGVIFGLPAVRIRGLMLAVVTLAMAVGLQTLWFSNSDFSGANGVAISGPKLFGLDLRARIGIGTFYPSVAFSILVLVVLVLVAVAVAWLRTNRLGSAMLAVKANERSAAASGISVVRTKLAAFAIGAFIAGLGGALMAYQQANVSEPTFDMVVGLGLFATAYMAGITSVSGGVLAGMLALNGIVYQATTQWLSLTEGWYEAITGVGLVLTVIMNPEGIVGPFHDRLKSFRRRPARAGTAEVTSGPPIALVPDAEPEVAEEAALVLSDISVHYGGTVAVDGVSFEVRAGEIVGLIGPNGAGKTTLVDAITGFVDCAGKVRLLGANLNGQRPHARARQGLARTFQAIELWDDLTVEENVTAGANRLSRQDSVARLDDTLRLLRIADLRDHFAGDLSQGQRQLVSIARALATGPSVLLLDEPAGGLDTTESAWLGERLRAIRDAGIAVLLIDHDMSLVLAVCDRIQVMNFGKIIASGTPAEVRANRAVADAYLGDTHSTAVVAS